MCLRVACVLRGNTLVAFVLTKNVTVFIERHVVSCTLDVHETNVDMQANRVLTDVVIASAVQTTTSQRFMYALM